MANIENRRIKRRLGVIAAAVGGLAVIALIVLAAVLLPKSCAGKRTPEAQESAQPSASLEPQTTEAPSVPTSSPETTAFVSPSPSPAASPSDTGDEPAVTAEPQQITEERSEILIVLTSKTKFSADGAAYTAVEGSASVTFVNNTDQTMYAACFTLGGLSVSKASVNGAAARFITDEGDILRLPFVNELKPGQTAELYFEFSAAVGYGMTLELPTPAYDTVCDIVCFAFAQGNVSASDGSVSPAGDGAYRILAEGVRSLSVSFTV